FKCLPGSLICAVENATRFIQSSAESRPGFRSRSCQLLQPLVRGSSVSLHAGHRGIYLFTKLGCKVTCSGLHPIGRFAPSVHLRLDLALENSFLLLHIFPEGLEVVLYFILEMLPLLFQLRLCRLPDRLTRLGLLPDRALELVAHVAQVGNELIGLPAG